MNYNFSVLICSKNGHLKLNRMLKSIFEQTISGIEIILIDDGSKIPIQADTHRLQLIRHAKSQGLIKCRNKLASLAVGEFLIFLDDDVILDDKNLFIKSIEILREDPKIGALGIHQRGVDGGWMELQPAKKIIGSAQTYFGWAHIIRRCAWKITGPFREIFQYGREETDFSLRLWDNGYSVVSSESLSVIHDVADVGKKGGHRDFLNKRNLILAILLNYPSPLVPSWIKGAILNLKPLHDSLEPVLLFRIRIVFAILLFLPYIINNRKPVSMQAIDLYFNKTKFEEK